MWYVKAMNKTLERTLIIVPSLLVLFIIMAGYAFLMTIIARKPITVTHNVPVTQKIELKSDSDLKNRLVKVAAVNADLSNISIIYIDSYADKPLQGGQYDPVIDPLSEHPYLAKITVQSGRDNLETDRIVAHEYLHHIWNSDLTKNDKDMLSSNLPSALASDSFMINRLAGYQGIQTSAFELFSFYCTESSDSFISAEVLELCNRYIDRSKLVLLR